MKGINKKTTFSKLTSKVSSKGQPPVSETRTLRSCRSTPLKMHWSISSSLSPGCLGIGLYFSRIATSSGFPSLKLMPSCATPSGSPGTFSHEKEGVCPIPEAKLAVSLKLSTDQILKDYSDREATMVFLIQESLLVVLAQFSL